MILRHLRYILTKHTRRIDDDARAHCTPVCMHGKDSSVLHVHTRHACIQRKCAPFCTAFSAMAMVSP